MVKLPQVIAANKALATQPIVYVGMGATSGINLFALQALVSAFASQGQQGKGLRAYIVGRKPEDGQKIIEECLKQCLKATLTYVLAADLSLLSEVDKASKEIERLERLEEQRGNGKARVDILVASPSPVLFQPRTETAEGIDKFTSLLYYARIRMITNLLPLLEASTLPSAHVISIYAAGISDPIYPNDLTLREPGHYGFRTSRGHVVHMKTLVFERLAQQHKRISFNHNFPGLVITPGFQSPELPIWFKRTWSIIGGLVAYLMSMSHEESGQRTLFLATEQYPALESGAAKKKALRGTDGQIGSGAYGTKEDGEIVPLIDWNSKSVVKEAFAKEVWEHTFEVMDIIRSGKRYTK